MLGFQTFACLHDIPVVRSSTDKLQDVYVKAKDKSRLIRYPCHIAESIADKSLKLAVTVANPLVKPLSRPVRLIDDFAVEKIRQIEAKYPVINTSTENVLTKFNEKTEPVRNVISTVKDTTASTIQHGKEKVTNVATATINKATDVADTVYSFCETHVPGQTTPVNRNDFARRTTFLWERIKTTIVSPIVSLFIWIRLLIVSFLLRIKQTNDAILNRIPNKSFLTYLPQRSLILIGILLEFVIERIQPVEQIKQQQSTSSRTKPFTSRQTLKPSAFVTTRQSVVLSHGETTVTRTGGHAQSQVDTFSSGNDINKLHGKLHPTDIERLYSRLPADAIPIDDSQEFLTDDQQLLRAKLSDNHDESYE